MERWCPELRWLVPQSRHSLRHAQRSVVMGKDNNVYEFTQILNMWTFFKLIYRFITIIINSKKPL